MKYPVYRFFRPIIIFLMHLLFHIKVVNKDNIPKAPYILVGNHKHNFDAFMLISSTKDTVRFLAKKELIDGPFGFLFKHLALIPVDRTRHNPEAIKEAKDVLLNNGVVGIFPEGTFNKTEYIIRPFKMGAVKIASDTHVKIVPFAIKGNYSLFKRTEIIFGKPYEIESQDLKGENITLMNKVIELLKK